MGNLSTALQGVQPNAKIFCNDDLCPWDCVCCGVNTNVKTNSFDIEFIKGIKNVMFGGEGLFFAVMRGPGKVWLQSLPISRLASRILQYSTVQRKEEGSVLGGLGNLLDGRE